MLCDNNRLLYLPLIIFLYTLSKINLCVDMLKETNELRTSMEKYSHCHKKQTSHANVANGGIDQLLRTVERIRYSLSGTFCMLCD